MYAQDSILCQFGPRNLSPVQQLISHPILVHFWWELYHDKTKKANIGKRRNVYATNIDDTYIDSPTPCIDHVPDSPYGGIDLPPDEFYQVHALSSRHPPSQRPGQPSRPPFRPQSQHSRPTNPLEGMMVVSFWLLKSISY